MEEEIKTLLVKYITGNADAEERQFVRQWLDESQDNVDYFTSLKAAWDDALYHPDRRVVNTNAAFDKLRKKLAPDEVPASPEANQKGKRAFSIRKAAVAAALIFIIGVTSLYVYRKSDSHTPVQTALNIFVPNGKMKKLLLPDSTEVWLNAGTHFSYATGFGEHTREVSLEGEGYFAVKHIENIPFIVKAHGYAVRDIGTVFTVSAYPDNKIFRTAVIEGEVEVTGAHMRAGHAGKVLLTRNEVLNINVQSAQKDTLGVSPAKADKPAANHLPVPEAQPQISSAPEMERYAGWKDQLLVFDEETFDEVAQRLERTFDVKIQITNPQLAGLRYTGRFNKVQNIMEALRIIKETTPIVYHLEKDTIIISTDKK